MDKIAKVPHLREELDWLDQTYGVEKEGFFHQEHWQLLVAIMLSAQSTDKQVDEVLPKLYGRFPTVQEIAQATEVVLKKEDGLDTEVEQGGKNFSGGQRQRLTIARALVKKPEILILDDSSSALDFATDAALRMAIGAMEDKPTLFIVSQRTSAIQYADQIVVLDDGNVVGLGTHEELMDSCEVYREIYESQYKKSK